jgi:hypothetical protein
MNIQRGIEDGGGPGTFPANCRLAQSNKFESESRTEFIHSSIIWDVVENLKQMAPQTWHAKIVRKKESLIRIDKSYL